MTKRRYTFGKDYLMHKCRLGIAMIQGERHYWLSDGYTNWLITDMDPATHSIAVKIWLNKPDNTQRATVKLS